MDLYDSDIYSEKDEDQKACKESELKYIAQKRGFCAQIVDDEDQAPCTVLCGLIGFVMHVSLDANTEIKVLNKEITELRAKVPICEGDALSADFLSTIKEESVRAKTFKRWAMH